MSSARLPTSTTRRLGLAATATAFVLLLGACGAGASTEESPSATAQDSQSGGGGGEGADVRIVDNAFDPAEIQVSAGTSVDWENTGDATHTVTFDDGDDSGDLNSGATYSRTFDDAGEFAYVCSIHPQMTGTVTVGE